VDANKTFLRYVRSEQKTWIFNRILINVSCVYTYLRRQLSLAKINSSHLDSNLIFQRPNSQTMKEFKLFVYLVGKINARDSSITLSGLRISPPFAEFIPSWGFAICAFNLWPDKKFDVLEAAQVCSLILAIGHVLGLFT
jgi:hypothetical protein